MIEPQKKLTIISGFSGTLKTTTINSMKADLVLYSPVKILMKIRNDFFNRHYLSPVHHFYAQYYALSQCSDLGLNHIVVERSIWDYKYFYNVLYDRYLKCDIDNLTNADQIDHVGVFKDLKRLLPGYEFNVTMLINNSDLLKSKVIEGKERNRMEIYKSIDEYNKSQDDYLDYCMKVISDLDPYINSVNYIDITDDYFKSILNGNK